MFLPPLPVQGFLCAEEMHQSEFHPTHGNLKEGTSSRVILNTHLYLWQKKKKRTNLQERLQNKQIEIVLRARSFFGPFDENQG